MVRLLFLAGLLGCACVAAAFLFPDDWRNLRDAVAGSTVGSGSIVSDVYHSLPQGH